MHHLYFNIPFTPSYRDIWSYQDPSQMMIFKWGLGWICDPYAFQLPKKCCWYILLLFTYFEVCFFFNLLIGVLMSFPDAPKLDIYIQSTVFTWPSTSLTAILNLCPHLESTEISKTNIPHDPRLQWSQRLIYIWWGIWCLPQALHWPWKKKQPFMIPVKLGAREEVHSSGLKYNLKISC